MEQEQEQEQRTSYQTGIELESSKNMALMKNGSSENKARNSNYNNAEDKKCLLSNSNHLDFMVGSNDGDGDGRTRTGITGMIGILVFILLLIGVVVVVSQTDTSSTSKCITDPILALKDSSSLSGIKNGAVATDEKICSELSVKILQELGGNAVDAAVTAALCLGVVNPASSGIGGGAFMVIHMKDRLSNTSTTEVIDGREEAPSMAKRDMYKGNDRASLDGGLAIAVPGELRALELAHKRHGSLPWKTLVTPVALLAAQGFPVSSILAYEIQAVAHKIMLFPALANLLSRPTNSNEGTGTQLLEEGDILKQPILAKTLRKIALEGADAIYKGELALNIVADINAHGGIFKPSDLYNYKPIIRKPLIGRHVSGFTIVGVPPPSSGGAVIIGAARFISGYTDVPLGTFQDTLAKHRYVEALKHTFALRMSMSDPSDLQYTNISKQVVEDLISTDYIDALRDLTLDHDVLPLSKYGGVKWSQLNDVQDDASTASKHTATRESYLDHPNRRRTTGFHYLEDHGTSSFSIIDTHRNAVSMTSTINTIFGSGVFSESTGIIFNSDMDDFSSPNMTNVFGLQPSESNYIKPHKRPISSMSPTLIFKSSSSTSNSPNLGKLFMALGSSGGPKIISAVLQTFLNHAVLGYSLYKSVSQPRIHDQLLYQSKPMTLYDHSILHQIHSSEEYITVSNKTLQALLRRAQTLLPVGYLGTVQAISIDFENDSLDAVSDIRKMGFPAGY